MRGNENQRNVQMVTAKHLLGVNGRVRDVYSKNQVREDRRNINSLCEMINVRGKRKYGKN